MQETSQIWWREITGPRSFVRDVAGYLLESSVIVSVPDDLPWRHEMRQEIQSELREQVDFEEITVIPIDTEEVEAGISVADYILNRFALGEVARQYRRKSGKTIPQFIVENEVLKNCVLWIKGFTQENVGEWVEFLMDFNSRQPKNAQIVLEIRDDIPRLRQTEVKEIDYSAYISEYNLQLFGSILLDRISEYSGNWKRYIATLAAHLCVTDAEIAECFIHGGNHLETDPIGILQLIAADTAFSRRGAAKGSNHVLAITRNNQLTILKRRIWEAQVQILFPIVEAKRVQLIERIESELRILLRAWEINQFKECVENPYDMEWGTLSTVMNKKDLGGEFYLKSLSSADRAMIKSFREIRNTLAHCDCCSIDQVRGIIGQ